MTYRVDTGLGGFLGVVETIAVVDEAQVFEFPFRLRKELEKRLTWKMVLSPGVSKWLTEQGYGVPWVETDFSFNQTMKSIYLVFREEEHAVAFRLRWM